MNWKFWEKKKRVDTEEEEFKPVTPEEAKRKIFLYIGAVLVAIVLFSVFASRGKHKKGNEQLTATTDTSRITPPVVNEQLIKEQWLRTTGKEVDSLKAQVKALQDLVNTIATQIGEQNKVLKQLQKDIKTIRSQRSQQTPVSVPPAGGTGQSESIPQPAVTDSFAYVTPLNPQRIKAIVSFDTTYKETSVVQQSPVTSATKAVTAGVVQVDTGFIYIPTGSYVRVRLLTAVDAPCGSNTQPYPVLMEVVDRFQLPNSKHSNAALRCFILGEAKGELSTGRAVIRAQRISCVRSNSLRVALDAPVQGWIVSAKDGRLGLAGEVVTKQGGKIALGLIANALKAAGEIGSQAQFTTVTTPLGQQQILTGSALKAAGYKALGETGKQAADWFMERAKEIYPVITVKAGEMGYFFLKEGLKIKIGGEKLEENSIISQLDTPAGK